ncbi:MAG TPA: nicotinate phosphoribosyltransferase [Verrucomicrobiae bacterium]|nr:nicotinate phosphoribosyltransferase [Verrucomicrobiae bacterium]
MAFPALLTDLYQLTMLAGYFRAGMHRTQAVFDLFFRRNPFGGSHALFAGLEPALAYLENLAFGEEEIAYLQGLSLFDADFLEFLRGLRFRGTVTAPPEGSVVFAGEPILSVEGTLAETQLVETALLNMINFHSLVATKASRVVRAAGGKTVIEFGLRRAQGPDGALSVARGARVGGIASTSNLLAGKLLDMPVKGTHAHSWIMAFPDEISAFRSYAAAFPVGATLLVDTYDTLRSGIPNAITVAGEVKERGGTVGGIRLDSGDTLLMSREARRMLDEAGLPEVKIVASGDLDEYAIEGIERGGGCVDIYGVGTRLAVCHGEGALGGVYKLVEAAGIPRLKLSSDPAKTTLPGKKRLYRAQRGEEFAFDLVCLQEEEPEGVAALFRSDSPLQPLPVPVGVRFGEVRRVAMREGVRTGSAEPAAESAERGKLQLSRLPPGCLRLRQPEPYPVYISAGLNALRLQLAERIKQWLRSGGEHGT